MERDHTGGFCFYYHFGILFALSCCMTLLGLIITLVIIGLILWLINSYVPMDPKVKTILNVVVVLVLVVWLIQGFGLLGPLNQPLAIPRR